MFSSISSGQIMSSFKMAYEIIPDNLMTQVDGPPAIRAARNPDPAVLEALLTHYHEKTTNLQGIPPPPIRNQSPNADAFQCDQKENLDLHHNAGADETFWLGDIASQSDEGHWEIPENPPLSALSTSSPVHRVIAAGNRSVRRQVLEIHSSTWLHFLLQQATPSPETRR